MRSRYLFGEFELNPASRELLRNGQPVALRPRSLECLIYLIEHRDRAVGRDELIAAVWGRVDASDTVVAQALLRVRKALDDTGSQQAMIRTLPRFGYRWVAPVRELAIPSDSAAGTADHAGGRDADSTPSAFEPYAEADSETDADFGPDDLALVAADAAEIALPAATGRAASGGDIEFAHGAPPPSTARRRLPRPAWLLFVALVLAIGIGAFLYSRHSAKPPPSAADEAVLVMPVTVIPMDAESAWIRLGGMDYMAARLRSSGINVLPSEQALRLGAAIEGDAPDVARRKLRSISDARWIALPEMRQERGSWRIRLHLFDGDAEQWIEAKGSTALAAAAAATDLWLRQLGGQGEAGPPPTPTIERLHRLDAEIFAGRLPEARRLIRSWPQAERSDPRFRYREAKVEFRAGNFDGAAELFQRALDQAQEADAETRVGALLGLGGVERNRTNLEAAKLRFTEALTLAQTLKPDHVNSRLVAFGYQGRGIVRAQQGDLDASIEDLGQARVWAERSGDLVALGVSGHNLGKAEGLSGDYVQALREYDRAIEIFERFHVNDHLANSLHEKAWLELVLARPSDALASAGRAAALVPKLESDGLAVEVLAVVARIQIAVGHLRDADRTTADMRTHGARESDPLLREALLRLHLARGELAEAKALARGASPSGAGDGLVMAGVQVAVRSGERPLAGAWLSGTAPEEQDARYHAVAVALARALVARGEGDRPGALQHLERAAAVAGASPEAEIQAGVLQALVLLDGQQYDAASAILGRLVKYAETDYRVAWTMLRLYRALGDQHAAAATLQRVEALRGDRPLAVEPVL